MSYKLSSDIFEQHPLGKLLPQPSEEQFEQLKKSMKEHGQKYPALVFEEKILDGWSRYRASRKLGLILKLKKFKGTPEEALQEVAIGNIHRRHLNPSQLACCAALIQQELKKTKTWNRNPNGYNHLKISPGPKKRYAEHDKSSYVIAKGFGISGRLVEKAISVKRQAPELFEKILKGDGRVESGWQAVRQPRGPRLDHVKKTVVPPVFASYHEIMAFHQVMLGHGYLTILQAREDGAWAGRYYNPDVVASPRKFTAMDYAPDLKSAIVRAGKEALKI